MAPRLLHVAEKLALPREAAVETFGVLGKRRSGKSNGAVVLFEEFYASGIPAVAIDPKGDWWGIQSSADGKGPGLPVPVFGGHHGNLPLEPTGGELVAKLVVEERLTCIVDCSAMSQGGRDRFLADFMRVLYNLNEDPLHVFLEEAHDYVPQSVPSRRAAVVGACTTLVTQGGFKGLGVTAISQRPARIHNDVLTQMETLLVYRLPSAPDQKAVLGWVKYHGLADEMMATLGTLAPGECWLWSPAWLERVERVQLRRRRTFDSGATPKMGGAAPKPKTMADVDIPAVEARMKDTIERAKAEDPKELRRRLAALDRELAESKRLRERVEAQLAAPIEVPVVPAETIAAIERLRDRMIEWTRAYVEKVQQAVTQLSTAASPPQGYDEILDGLAAITIEQPAPPPSPPKDGRPRAPLPAPGRARPVPEGVRLGERERRILTVLAIHGDRTQSQLATQTGYSAKASTIGAGLSALRKAGYVADGQPIRATPEGIAWLGDYEPLPTGPELLTYWRANIGERERKILDVLMAHYPEAVAHGVIAAESGYSPDASTIGAGLSKLRKLGLVEGWRAADEFMEAIR